MPFPDGTMTDEEFAHVQNKLMQHWEGGGGRKPCRTCGSDKIYLHPSLLQNSSDKQTFNGPFTRLPTVMTYCQNCGLADHYVARQFGINVDNWVVPPPIVAPIVAPPPTLPKKEGDNG